MLNLPISTLPCPPASPTSPTPPVMVADLTGHYCLDNDVALIVSSNFIPIGSFSTPFTGRLNG